MKTLHLNLKKKWFDMILSGEKKEEYREIKDYWIKQLVYCIWSEDDYEMSHAERLKRCYDDKITFNNFDSITFSNGYTKKRHQFEIELKSIEIGTGKYIWGAIPNKRYFVLHLGEIIK
jgi:hypothetical protein